MTDSRDVPPPVHERTAEAQPAIVGRPTGGGRVRDQTAAREADLDRALSLIWMAYQPIVSGADGQVFGYEALVRTEDPVINNPGLLFEVAEEFDRVAEVERLIHRKIADQMDEVPEDASLMVNVHPCSLDADFLCSKDGPLSSVAPRVVLEITERSSLHETDDVQGRIAVLRDLGFRIAIDDLGAGYAGLTSFAMLNPDMVKFDMALIRDVHLHPLKARVVQSMTTMCRDLEILTVAEGIECVEESDCVIELGCELLQGYYFARPEKGFIEPEDPRQK